MAAGGKNNNCKYWGLLIAASVVWVVYMVSQYMAYIRLGWDFVSWHLHLAPYVLLLLVWLFARCKATKTSNALTAILSVIITLFVIELGLTIALTTPLYNKFKYDKYNYYHTWPTGQKTHQLATSEFSYTRPTNSLGFADKEWSLSKQGKKRVIALGDSFTEGDGAPADSAFPVLLQQLLNADKDSTDWEVLNAGTCGSDPVFDFEKLNGLLLPYQPDIVLQVVSSRDFTSDIQKRGGFERFQPDKTIQCKPLPWWFYPCAISNICQMAVGAFHYMGYASADEHLIKQTGQQLVSGYSTLAQQQKFKFFLVLMPYREELENQKCTYNFAELINNLPPDIKVIDLLPAYRKWLALHHKKTADVYWTYDGHHNSTGYVMMAECIAQQL
ncbi:MAG TPA: hypothetical protein PLW44_03350 [Chitinophagales bacterium]|nr:hypothetical protein [Chitinophagales bacterium]